MELQVTMIDNNDKKALGGFIARYTRSYMTDVLGASPLDSSGTTDDKASWQQVGRYFTDAKDGKVEVWTRLNKSGVEEIHVYYGNVSPIARAAYEYAKSASTLHNCVNAKERRLEFNSLGEMSRFFDYFKNGVVEKSGVIEKNEIKTA